MTIPKPIREKLGIGPGSEVEFVDRGDCVEIVRVGRADDPDVHREAVVQRLLQMRGTLDTKGMDGKTVVDRLRGPRDDLDAG